MTDNQRMETRRLELLAELSRLGSMHAVADALGTTTSTVSQQLAALAREMGTQLTEPDGRRVRLTPAGRLLAEHAMTILAEVEEARRDLAPGGEPAGTLHVAGFTTAIRRYLLPVIAGLTASHPRIHVLIREHETAEALQLLAADQADLALIYDFNLAPVTVDQAITSSPLWTAPWGLQAAARHPRYSPASVRATGLATPGAPPMRTSSAPSLPWPGSPRASPTGQTASN
jgi:DNA-binding transcriptional LysR family regulator